MAVSLESVTKIAEARMSCSACERRSAAINSGVDVLSAMIRISLGPAIISTPTIPATIFLAIVT